MITLLYRGTTDIIVGNLNIKANNFINLFPDDIWEITYNRYKGYFDKRTVSESNPDGQFIISKRSNYALDQSKEAGRNNTIEDIENEIEDNKVIVVNKRRNKNKDKS